MRSGRDQSGLAVLRIEALRDTLTCGAATLVPPRPHMDDPSRGGAMSETQAIDWESRYRDGATGWERHGLNPAFLAWREYGESGAVPHPGPRRRPQPGAAGACRSRFRRHGGGRGAERGGEPAGTLPATEGAGAGRAGGPVRLGSGRAVRCGLRPDLSLRAAAGTCGPTTPVACIAGCVRRGCSSCCSCRPTR